MAALTTLVLGGCAPTEQGADESASPGSTVSEEPAAEPSATSTPYVIDEY